MKKISFIIVNYKTPVLLERCVENLLNIWPNKEIIVVDNDSQDDSVSLVKKRFGRNKEITLIEEPNNGISAGYNKGLEKATGDYYCYLGTDAFPSREAVEKLISYMEADENKDIGIVTPMLVLSDGSMDWDAHRGFSTPWSSFTHFAGLNLLFPKSKIFNQYFQGYKDFTKPHEIDVCISHFMLMRKEVIEKIGKWDEKFWVYGEDLDICYRTKKAGFKIMYLPDIKVLHFKGATVGRKYSKEVEGAANISQSIKNRLTKGTVIAMELFYKKHLAKKYPFFINWLVFLGIFLMKFVRGFLVKKH
ncbi:hypothetical protein A3K42_01185 [candidate division WWE3 bacterium RBG_13_37_7]|uniref:Glycosyltransferase 2-like domain-containing protein n=1 Tax=candidate division WWE3 bacterium RBG_13_37_7 TaxID=1802609 RepID=A0A1F4U1L3_UNCKA|nr:MAG: hypothetical protein A3K42_01185 [candidate division WWE3 bacterium RBG_13_37_7]